MTEHLAYHHNSDVAAIRTLIARQFTSLNWFPGQSADWDAFRQDFHPDATLFPSARRRQKPDTKPGTTP